MKGRGSAQGRDGPRYGMEEGVELGLGEVSEGKIGGGETRCGSGEAVHDDAAQGSEESFREGG